jgi:hypothetical protein
LFLLVGALYNVVLAESGAARWRWLALYLFVGLALWSSGMKQVEECLDPEAHRRRAVRLGDAAVLVLLAALGNRAVVRVVGWVGEAGSGQTAQIAGAVLSILLGGGAASYLWRRPGAGSRVAWVPATAIAVVVGLGLGLLLRAQGWMVPAATLPLLLPVVLADELIFRGCLQRAWQERWAGRARPALVAAAAAAATIAIAALATGGPLLMALAGPVVPSVMWAVTGRTSASFLVRATVLAVIALLPAV